MRRVFPMHGAEASDIYEERIKRANYLPFAGEVVDYIVASLSADPLSLTAEPQAPEFYQEFTSSIDGRSMSLNDLLKQQILTALIKRCSWTLVDLPPRDDGAFVESEADEEEIGLLRAFAFPVDPECVLDYEMDGSGALEWALVRTQQNRRNSLEEDRSRITERYTHYTRTNWQRWDVSFVKGKEPKPNDDIALSAQGVHSFERVPLARLEVTPGLWAMAKLAPLARALLNKRSATDWSMYRHLFPILGAFLAPEMGAGGEIPATVAQDPDRATNQVYGIGRVMVFGKDDELRYTSPDTGIYEASMKDLDGLRDEIHRVVHQMALAANNSAASLGRSGDSKAQDKAASTVILTAIGDLARKHSVEIAQLAAAGRRDPSMEWTAHGMDDFDSEDLKSAIDEEAVLETLDIPSVTWKRLRKFHTARKTVRGIATPEQIEEIRDELEEQITVESMKPVPPPVPVIDPNAIDPNASEKQVPPLPEKGREKAKAA